MDAITRDNILTLTRRVADLEAAMEVHRNLLKDLLQGQAHAAGTSLNANVIEAQMTEAVLEQREKMAMGVQPEEPAVPVQFVIDLTAIQ